METVNFLRLPHGLDLELPSYQSVDAAGMDIRSAESFKLFHGTTKALATGLAVAVPKGFELQVRSRSGLAAKHGVFVTNGIGTIDADYRGEIFVVLSHLGRNAYQIERGDRIAQLVLTPVIQAIPVEVSVLDATLRGTGGLGSTGR